MFVWLCRYGRIGGRGLGRAGEYFCKMFLTEIFKQLPESRDKKSADYSVDRHAKNDSRSKCDSRLSACSCSKQHRKYTEHECECCHHDRTETNPSCVKCRLSYILSSFMEITCLVYNKNCIFCRESKEKDDADLCVTRNIL